MQLERASERKHEFRGGEIFVMAGGSLNHSLLAANWIFELRSNLRGRDCRVFTSDLRVRTPLTGSFLYPDISVVCGEPHLYERSDDILTNAEYILVHVDSPHVEQYTRQPDESWLLRDVHGLENSIEITSIGCVIRLIDVYAGVSS